MGLILTSAGQLGAYCDVGLIVTSAVRHGAYCDVALIVTSAVRYGAYRDVSCAIWDAAVTCTACTGLGKWVHACGVHSMHGLG